MFELRAGIRQGAIGGGLNLLRDGLDLGRHFGNEAVDERLGFLGSELSKVHRQKAGTFWHSNCRAAVRRRMVRFLATIRGREDGPVITANDLDSSITKVTLTRET